jgi:hypothetical protein
VQNSEKVVVLILAHPDDEVFLIPYLTYITRNKKSVHVIYLTDGQGFQLKFNCETRFIESKKFLSKLYKNSDWNFYSLGEELGIEDSKLYLNLDKAFDELFSLIESLKPDAVVTLCAEGGHPDHDAVSVISTILSRKIPGNFICFSCYRNSRFFPFTVLPHKDNPKNIINININFVDRLKNIFLTLMIPSIFSSQWRTWIGLFPFLLSLNLFLRKFKIYKLDPSQLYRLYNPALYQKRMGIDSKIVNQSLFDFTSKHDKDLHKKLIDFLKMEFKK